MRRSFFLGSRIISMGKFARVLLLIALLAACTPAELLAEPENPGGPPTETSEVQATTGSVTDASVPSPTPTVRETLDLTQLPIGDGRLSTQPQVGYLWSCRMQFDPNAGGAQATGEWYDAANGTWNFNLKPVVDGTISWDSQFSQTIMGGVRMIEANGLPAHPTGSFPVSASDDAAQFDRNPNNISAQSYQLELPAKPGFAAATACVGGEVGISVDGVVINSAIDARGDDAVSMEIQDACQGHPHVGGVYHYHGYSLCLEDQNASGQSALIGWALDGFGIYGPYAENGQALTSADLDECHGRTSLVMWEGEWVEMYHYVATFDFPYTVGCFRGTAVVFADVHGGGPPP